VWLDQKTRSALSALSMTRCIGTALDAETDRTPACGGMVGGVGIQGAFSTCCATFCVFGLFGTMLPHCSFGSSDCRFRSPA
jgi:hypothetical protein